MSMVKRYIEERIADISNRSGYSEEFLWGIIGEQLEADGMYDLEFIEAVAMEQDF